MFVRFAENEIKVEENIQTKVKKAILDRYGIDAPQMDVSKDSKTKKLPFRCGCCGAPSVSPVCDKCRPQYAKTRKTIGYPTYDKTAYR